MYKPTFSGEVVAVRIEERTFKDKQTGQSRAWLHCSISLASAETECVGVFSVPDRDQVLIANVRTLQRGNKVVLTLASVEEDKDCVRGVVEAVKVLK